MSLVEFARRVEACKWQMERRQELTAWAVYSLGSCWVGDKMPSVYKLLGRPDPEEPKSQGEQLNEFRQILRGA